MWPNPTPPDVAQLQQKAEKLRRLVGYMEEREPEISRTQGSWAVTQSWSIVKAVFEAVKRAQVDWAFLAVLQSYEMDARDRKVIERASMLLSRRSKKRAPVDRAVNEFLKTLVEYRLFSRTLDKVIASGRLHTGGPGSGKFTLINAGGFSSRVMDGVVARVAEASRLLGAKGLDRVLYGDVHVTNTVRRSARTMAFYVLNEDSLFIRANVPSATHDYGVDAVVHELAHRLHYKFLRPEMGPPGLQLKAQHFLPQSIADKALFDIYRRLNTQEITQATSSLPKSGETFEHKGEIYKVLAWVPTRGGGKIELMGPKGPAHVSLSGYHAITGGNSVFVSHYAKTSYQENFAEMVRAYCRDALPADQVRMLRGVLG